MASANDYMVDVAGLRKQFHVRPERWGAKPRVVHAVSDISFKLRPGVTMGIVGESGCGKSTVARLLMGLVEADGGDVRLAGQRLGYEPAQLKAVRRKVQMVFQDSFASLNPRMTVEASLMFGPVVHGVPRAEARRNAHELLARVGLEPARFAGRYPHEVSGGQRQRVNIARALALRPEVVIFDEAVSALDKSVEIQVLNLLQDLKTEFGLTYLFISHDLNVVQYISDQVLVMYLGKIVEIGDEEQIYGHPTHPYTQALLSAVPVPDPTVRDRRTQIMLTGDVPSPANPPSGCRFHTRCWRAQELCRTTVPELIERPDGAGMHRSACHFAEELPEVVAAD